MTSPVIVESIDLDQEQLELQLQRRLGSRVRDLRIVFRPGGIILQGRAATYYVKQLAQAAAGDITHMPILANDIEVC